MITTISIFTINYHTLQLQVDQGQIVFMSSSGELASDSSLTFDNKNKAVKMDRFIADSFYGDSINFRGREIRNAHLVDSSIDGLKHLSLESLALLGHSSTTQPGSLAVLIDKNGKVESTQHLQWDEDTMELRLPSLSSFSKSGLEIKSDVDFTSHLLKNVNIEANTTLDQLTFTDGNIENTVLHNVTVTDLNLGEVPLDSLTISQFDSSSTVGSLLLVGEDGSIQASSNIKQDQDGALLIDSQVILTRSMNLNGQDIYNANLKSGSIDGNIEVSVDNIKAKGSISLTSIQDDKTVTSDGLAVLGLDGRLKMGPISVDKNDGSLGDFKVHGTIDFGSSQSQDEDNDDAKSRGKIKDANIVGGTIDRLEKLSVVGETELGLGLQVSGETYLDGSLTVSGSVLGSGPYVDVSDKRFKKNIQRMESANVLDKICRLDGVSYELDLSNVNEHHRLGLGGRAGNNSNTAAERQFGFIAQEVEEIFPELVSTSTDYGEDDFKGLHYSRFVPLLVEGLKQLTEEVRELQEWKLQLMKEMNDMRKTIISLEESQPE